PNPTTDVLNVYFNSSAAAATSIRIFDISGKAVYTETLQAALGINQELLKIAHLPSGVYSLQIQNATETQQQLFVKE
ncbi:MAG: T9SS type A sorting domain-containing protein, partial [Bacteroidota bacterium]